MNHVVTGMCDFMVQKRVERINMLKRLMSSGEVLVRYSERDGRINHMLVHDEDPYDKLEKAINKEAARQLNITRDAILRMSGDINH